MREHFISFIWQHQLFSKAHLTTVTGDELQIISPGLLNHHSGPDFKEGKIKINGILWAGHIELHTRASDWLAHQHQQDPAYNNVILHVVFTNDVHIQFPSGKDIPTLELNGLISKEVIHNHERLMKSSTTVPCANLLDQVTSLVKYQAVEQAALRRLEQKAQKIVRRLHQTQGHWAQVILEVLFRGWGFGLNGQAFEDLAQRIPAELLLRSLDNHLRTSAIIFGMSGLLQGQDEYARKLQAEFDFLQKHYRLKPVSTVEMKFLRTRAYNFPTIRLGQLARVLCSQRNLFLQLQEFIPLKEWYALEKVEDFYWGSHTHFGCESKKNYFRLGRASLDITYINIVAPLTLASAMKNDNESMVHRIVQELESIKAENNKVTRMWENLGLRAKSALESQGMLSLYQNDCEKRKCASCPIGVKLIT